MAENKNSTANFDRSKVLLVPTRLLMPVGALVWMIASLMVLMVGTSADVTVWTGPMILALAIVFVCFLALFLMISRRHVRRILEIREPLSFILKFFDAPSYMIMAIMIFLGAAVRISTFVPNDIIAWFYTGLGAALMIAGIYLLVSYCATVSLPNSRLYPAVDPTIASRDQQTEK